MRQLVARKHGDPLEMSCPTLHDHMLASLSICFTKRLQTVGVLKLTGNGVILQLH